MATLKHKKVSLHLTQRVPVHQAPTLKMKG